MSKKISELNSVTQANNNDTLIMNQNGETVQITKEDLFTDTEQHVTDLDTNTKELLGIEEYDNAQTYDIGDYCLYEDVLYLCKVKITSPENFDSTKWEEANMVDGLVRTLAGATLDGGIAIKLGKLMIQTGQITNVNVPASSYTGYPITFPKEFSLNPNVFVTPIGNYNIGGQATSVSTTGFTLNARSYDNNARTGRTYHYLAIGFAE